MLPPRAAHCKNSKQINNESQYHNTGMSLFESGARIPLVIRTPLGSERMFLLKRLICTVLPSLSLSLVCVCVWVPSVRR